MNAESIKLDGRKVRAQKTYDEAHKKLIESAVELLNPIFGAIITI